MGFKNIILYSAMLAGVISKQSYGAQNHCNQVFGSASDGDKLNWDQPISVKQIFIGNTVYPLTKDLVFDFSVKQRTPVIPSEFLNIGIKFPLGVSPYEAIIQMFEKFHIIFQQLAPIIPSERTESQKDQWSAISALVDINAHRNLTPVLYRWSGTIESLQPLVIKWINEAETQLTLSQAPSDLPRYGIGSNINALVLWDRSLEQVTRILHLEYEDKLDL